MQKELDFDISFITVQLRLESVSLKALPRNIIVREEWHIYRTYAQNRLKCHRYIEALAMVILSGCQRACRAFRSMEVGNVASWRGDFQ